MANKTVTFPGYPQTPEAFLALPQAAQTDPYDVAALTVLAFSVYPQNRDAALAMLDALRGPRPLSPLDRQFIADRFRDKDYVPRSYFRGATPQNDYTPAAPLAVDVFETPYSRQNPGYLQLYLTSGGADSPRSVQLRQGKDGRWYLWEQFLLADIRKPESQNFWA